MSLSIESLSPGFARVVDPEGSAGAKEYVPVSAEHERAIAAGEADAANGVSTGFLGRSRRVRFNCTYDVMGADGQVTKQRAGFEHTFNPKKETMKDRACDGIRFRNPTWEQEVLAMPNGGRVYPTQTGWATVRANRLHPPYPTSFGVRVGGSPSTR